MEVFEQLKKEALYAINSHSKNLVYEVYGAARMARDLEAISYEQFRDLNTLLVRDGLNNPAKAQLR